MKKSTSVRVDPKKLEDLNKMGLSLTDIVQSALDKALKSKRCPTCGKKI